MTLVTIHPPRRHIAEKFTTFQTQATSRVRPPARARALYTRRPTRERASEREREGEETRTVERARETRRASRTERERTPPESTDELAGQGRKTDSARNAGATLSRIAANFTARVQGTAISAIRSFAIRNFDVLAKDAREASFVQANLGFLMQSRGTRSMESQTVVSMSREKIRGHCTGHHRRSDYPFTS